MTKCTVEKLTIMGNQLCPLVNYLNLYSFLQGQLLRIKHKQNKYVNWFDNGVKAKSDPSNKSN